MTDREFNSPGVFYVVMLLIFIGGLWAILHAGKSLTAPPDIAGIYDIVTADNAISNTENSLSLEQSGQYLSASLPDGVRLSGKLSQNTDGSIRPTMELSGKNAAGKSIHLTAAAVDGELRGTLDQSSGPVEFVAKLHHALQP